jgi:hypothetical protein
LGERRGTGFFGKRKGVGEIARKLKIILRKYKINLFRRSNIQKITIK